MKKIINIILASSAALCFFSCDDFLDKPTLGVMDDANFYSSPGAAFLAVTQCYYLTLHDVHGFDIPSFSIGNVATDDAEKGGSSVSDKPHINDLAYGMAKPDNSILNNYWKQMYLAIGECNGCLSNFSKYELKDDEGYPLSAEAVARYTAEVKFLRAFAYFELVKAFGGVPILTEPKGSGDANSLTRATEKESLEFIVDELKAAASGALPEKASLPAGELGRITNEAAWAMLGRVYMYFAKDDRSYYDLAVSALENVIGKFTLEPNFQNLWLEGNYKSDEAIMVDIRGDNSGSNIYGSFIPVYCSPRSCGAYGFDLPTQDLVNEFETGDKRLLFTIIQEGDIFPAGSSEEKLDFSAYPNTGYHNRKAFLVKDRRGPGWGDDAWSRIHIRYADILLLYSEALIRTNGDADKAVDCINQVRTRANKSVAVDAEAISRVLVIENKDLPMVKTSDDLLAAVKHERRVELAMEYNRFYDLKRWGEYVSRMAEYRGGSFQIGKSENFPIPQVEIDRTNGSIKQNQGY